jgi:hypothetical protein
MAVNDLISAMTHRPLMACVSAGAAVTRYAAGGTTTGDAGHCWYKERWSNALVFLIMNRVIQVNPEFHDFFAAGKLARQVTDLQLQRQSWPVCKTPTPQQQLVVPQHATQLALA